MRRLFIAIVKLILVGYTEFRLRAMYNHLLFFSYWIINSIVLFAASLVIPNHELVLGSWRFTGIEASIYSGFWLTFLIWVWWDFAIARKFNTYKKVAAFSFFFFVNVFSIWALSRFTYFTGLALLNLWWAIVIGFIAMILQRFAWRMIVKKGSVFGWI